MYLAKIIEKSTSLVLKEKIRSFVIVKGKVYYRVDTQKINKILIKAKKFSEGFSVY